MNVFGYLYSGLPVPIRGFASGRAELPPGMRPLLREIAQTCVGLRRFFPNARLYITGHADHPGPHDRNLEIGLLRAQAVERELTRNGLPPILEIVTSQGDSAPAQNVQNRSERNRRVELLFLRQSRPVLRIPGRLDGIIAAALFQPLPPNAMPDPCTVRRVTGARICSIDDLIRNAPPRSSPNFQQGIEQVVDAALARWHIPSLLGAGVAFPLREAVRNAILQQVDLAARLAIGAALDATGFGDYTDGVNSFIDGLRGRAGDGPSDTRPLVDGDSGRVTQPWGTSFNR
jgi:hypothetical protein